MKKLIYLLCVSTLFACNSEVKKTENSNENVNTQGEYSKKEKELVEVKVAAIGESMSEIAFEPKTLSVPANTRVKLMLENKSSSAGMLHNFVLVELGSGSEISAAGLKAGKQKNFIPNDSRVIAYTRISNMGETVTVEFDAPAKGSYHYICTYPGHLSMIGRFNVE